MTIYKTAIRRCVFHGLLLKQISVGVCSMAQVFPTTQPVFAFQTLALLRPQKTQNQKAFHIVHFW